VLTFNTIHAPATSSSKHVHSPVKY